MRIHERPWAMDRAGLDLLRDRVASAHAQPALRPRASDEGEDGLPAGPAAVELVEGVLVLRLTGALIQTDEDLSWLRGYGFQATGYGELRRGLALARQARAVFLEVDSPGGDAWGCEEIGGLVAGLRGVVPVHAHCASLCASAAYWIAAQADRLTALPSAWLGSIGTFVLLVDTAKMYEGSGIKFHLVASSPDKGVGSPGVPILPEQLVPWQRLVGEMQTRFRLAVAQGRGLYGERLDAVANAQLWTAWRGAELGLCDGTATREEALTVLRSGLGSASTTTPIAPSGARAVPEETTP